MDRCNIEFRQLSSRGRRVGDTQPETPSLTRLNFKMIDDYAG